MTETAREGRIFTFYSFKGGVGRTMALANLAYLAAHNGMRVLMMDWDLEAPGLAYYFRGLLDPVETRALKEAPGILDIVWDWRYRSRTAESEQEFNELAARFGSGTPFQECVRSIVDPNFIPPGTAIDFIGAGRSSIATPDLVSYEEALARFSWASFFDEDVGGIVVEELRKWSKDKYDLVLIDSRTGLADVAGLCTMQLPDEVALCFVLNRQNIDGVAKVAAAIRSRRSEEVKVRAIPMRVARLNTPEESDARAKAMSELKRVGGFSSDAAAKDLSSLSIPAAENVPFYETLAPFASADPSVDLLTLSYRRMASALLGREINQPALADELVTLVLRRLQPRHATVEYVSKLRTSEPNRAIAELLRLIESAYESELDGGTVEDEYVSALVDVAFSIEDPEYISECIELQSQALELLRAAASRSEMWRTVLTVALERHIASLRFESVDGDEEIALLEELDALLAESPTLAARLQRINHRRRAAWLSFSHDRHDAANQTTKEVLSLVEELTRDPSKLAPDQLEELLTAEIDMGLLRGNILSSKENVEGARREYRETLEKFPALESIASRTELRRMGADLHMQLALLPIRTDHTDESAKHAVEAARWGSGSPTLVIRFRRLIPVVLGARENPELVLSFCEAALGGGTSERSGRTFIANYYGRHLKLAVEYLEETIQLVEVLGSYGTERSNEVLLLVSSAADMVLKALLRRRQIVHDRSSGVLFKKTSHLISALENAGAPTDTISSMAETIEALKVRPLVVKRRAGRSSE